ncbi:hypothetical protein HYV57_04375 [Candidatus Peregrinibacteria bacterium]|nr:hypothetical protein [Candidatus Peregrinibacteria bacterium]
MKLLISLNLVFALFLLHVLFTSSYFPAAHEVPTTSLLEIPNAGGALSDLKNTGSPQFDVYAKKNGLQISVQGDYTPSELESCENTVFEAFSYVPRKHLSQLKRLTFSFDPEIRRGLGGGNQITIRCVNVTDDELKAVFLHEIGHIVDTGLFQGHLYAGKSPFYDGKNPLYRDDKSLSFYTLSWSAVAAKKDENILHFVSEYGATDPFEDFAETYVYYILHGPEFRYLTAFDPILAQKYDSMQKFVFQKEYYADSFSLPSLSERTYDITKLPYSFQ